MGKKKKAGLRDADKNILCGNQNGKDEASRRLSDAVAFVIGKKMKDRGGRCWAVAID